MAYVKWTKSLMIGLTLLVVSSLVGLYLPLVLRRVIDGGLGFGLRDILLTVCLFLVQAILVSTGHYLMAKSGEDLVADTRNQVIAHLFYSPLAVFHHQKSGDLSSRIVNDSTSLRRFTVDSLPRLVASLVTLLGTVIVLFVLDWQLSLTFLISFPLLFLVIMPLSNRSEKAAGQLQEDISRLTGDLTEHFREMELIKANVAEARVAGKMKQTIEQIKRQSLKVDLVEAWSSPLVLLILFGSIALIFTYGGQRVAMGSLTIGTLISFLIYLFQLLNPAGAVAGAFSEFAKMKGATKALETLLETPQEDLETGEKAVLLGDLTFTDVSFAYEDKLVLDQINLTIKQGQKVAFVGPSGAGKSTLTHLVTRFYPVTAGQISLDGLPIDSFNLRDWRQQIGLVSQHNALLSGSIRDNLLFGLERIPSDAELEQALAGASLLDEIRALDQGLDSPVGEAGKLLSGGQKQRLQIARAYLKNPSYIIFDEATANLDADTEYAITQSMKGLLVDKTAIIIAHRLSTVVDADVIYFLENQTITGVGNHQELLKKHPTYARFVAEQMI